MTNYTTSTLVTLKVSNIKSTVDSSQMAEALNNADITINSQLDETSLPSTVPSVIKLAATLYAASELLDTWSNKGENRNPTAKAWEAKADKLITSYIQEEPEFKPEQNYTSNQTSRTRAYEGYKGTNNRFY